ncbi:histidine phosphatase superfamily (branch 1) domain-containing protein [Sarocladium implicatum]|nr:histidine phosphatase superfamily (branch 1) domain-containing protein [Sarocladium implicatum]
MRLSFLLSLAPLAPVASAANPPAGRDITYSTVGGYFLQDEPDTVASSFDYAQWNLGLLNRTYPTDGAFDPDNDKPQWARFAHWVEYVTRKCQNNARTRYKVLVMGRHGQGFHNAAESYYGTPCYWSVLDGNGTVTWADAKLTEAGVSEARKAHAFFNSHFANDGFPYFQSYYSSPLTRCVTTANLTFGGIALPDDRPFEPVIKEYLREGISIHTCDRRSTKSHIHSIVPNFDFEEGFTEEDELWRGDEGETAEHQRARSKELLDDIFTNDDATWVSFSAHSGEIRRLLEVLGHREFSLATGQIIPVLVKAEIKESGESPTSTAAGFTAEATCTEPPVTSIAGEGCVCPTATPVLREM